MKVNNAHTNSIASKLNDVQSKSTKDALKPQGGPQAKAPNSAEVATSSNLNISEKAKARAEDFAKIKELATKATDVDEAKVAKLRELIDKNEYKVDAEAVADRLVDSHAVDSILGSQN